MALIRLLAVVITILLSQSAQADCPKHCFCLPDTLNCDAGCVINLNPLNVADPNRIHLVTDGYIRNCPPLPQFFALVNGIPDTDSNFPDGMDVYLDGDLVYAGLTYVDTTTNEGEVPYIEVEENHIVDVNPHVLSPPATITPGTGFLTTSVFVPIGSNLTVVANIGPAGSENLYSFLDNILPPANASDCVLILRNMADISGAIPTFTVTNPNEPSASLNYSQTATYTATPTFSTITVTQGANTLATTSQVTLAQQENAFYLIGSDNDGTTQIASVILPTTPALETCSIYAVNYDGTEELVVAEQDDVGPVYGLAWRHQHDDLFASVFYRRFNNLKPGDSLGVIYQLHGVNLNPATPTITPFIDLDAIFPGEFGSNANRCDNNDIVALAGSTKNGIGAITLSGDQNTLFVMDLFKQGLANENYIYAVPLTENGIVTPYIPSDPRIADIVKIPILFNTDIMRTVYHNAPFLYGSGSTENVRPFALKYHNGRIYVGIVNTAQYSSFGQPWPDTATALAVQNNLHAYVYSFPDDPSLYNDPTSWVLETHFPLNYIRGKPLNLMTPVTGYDFIHGSWFPWTDIETVYFPNTLGSNGPTTNWPTPILSDIEFILDQRTNQEVMILGLRDRTADQLLDERSIDQQYTANSCGDTLRVDKVNGQWIVEQGIYDGEQFFTGNTTNIHGETTQGSLAANYSIYNEVVSTVLDPVKTYSGGFTMLPINGPLAGQRRFGVTIFMTTPNFPGTLGKSNGLGAVVSLSDVIPYCLKLGKVKSCKNDHTYKYQLSANILAQDPTQQVLLSQERYNVDAVFLDGSTVTLASGVFFSDNTQIDIPSDQFDFLYELRIYDTNNTHCALVINKTELTCHAEK